MTKIKFPIKYFEDNIVFSTEGSVYAYYEVESFNYDYRSNDEIMALHNTLEALYWNITSDTHALIIPISQSIEDHRQFMSHRLDERLLNYGRNYVDKSLDALFSKNVTEYRFFIGVKLNKKSFSTKSLKKEIGYLFKDFKRYFFNRSGFDDSPEVFEEEFKLYKLQEELIYSKLNNYLEVTSLDSKTLEWLIRRGFYRSISDVPLRVRDKPYNEKEVLTLSEGRIDNSNGRRIVLEQLVEGGLKKGYVAFLTLSYIPDKTVFPGNEWLYCLQKLSFPVEVSLRTEMIEYSKALSQVMVKKKELKAEDDHALESGEDSSYHILNSKEEANELESDLRTDKFPLIKTSIVICVSSTNLKELNGRIQAVKDLYNDLLIQVEVPFGDQWRAFNESLPGSTRLIKDYIHFMEPAAIASSMIGASKKLRDSKVI